MKTYLLIILASLLLIGNGCSQPPLVKTDVLLMNIQSTNCSTNEGFLNFENDSVNIAYIFWAEKGIVGLFIHNKLSKPLYVDWKKCSYITGTTKHDYWTETVTMTTESSSSTFGTSTTEATSQSKIWKNFFNPKYYSTSNSNSQTNLFSNTYYSSATQIVKPERITFIPPNATISISRYSIYENDIPNIPSNMFLQKDTTLLMEGNVKVTGIIKAGKRKGKPYQYDSLALLPTKVSLSFVDYSPENSPLSFRSFITYSTNENFTTEAYVNNYFYVARVTQMSVPIFEAKKVEDSGSNNDRNIWATPQALYVYRRIELKQP